MTKISDCSTLTIQIYQIASPGNYSLSLRLDPGMGWLYELIRCAKSNMQFIVKDRPFGRFKC